MVEKNALLRILLIEDNSGDARLIEEMLKDSELKVETRHITQLCDIQEVTAETFDLMLLDLNLPDSSGLETVLNAHKTLPQLPIIVLTGLDNEELSLSAIQAGAQDYLVKNETDAHQLVKTIQYALRRHNVLKNLSEASDTKVAYLSTHNVLTGLPNQQLFLDKLQLMIKSHEKLKKTFALSFLEIHELEKLISGFGHQKKDDVIKRISKFLSEVLPRSVFISHYSENMFALLHPKTNGMSSVSKDIGLIQIALAELISIDNFDYFPSYNIGVSLFPFDGEERETLIKSAQMALNKAALRGPREYDFYMKTVYPIQETDDIILYSDIKSALERKEVFVVYQPQIHIAQKKVIGVEALLRWNHPKLGMISPEKFVHLAEESHFIAPLGTWVLETAAQQYKTWQRHVHDHLPLRMCVNISVLQLHNDDIVYETVRNILHKYKIPPQCFELELTESIFIEQAELAIEKLNKLKSLGIQIAIDDFGQGYSALSYLSHLPIDRLKLDKTFVDKNFKSSPASLVVESIIKLAHSLQIKVIAEGVETEKQLDVLKEQNCDEVQGYYFSKPVQEKRILEIIENNFNLH